MSIVSRSSDQNPHVAMLGSKSARCSSVRNQQRVVCSYSRSRRKPLSLWPPPVSFLLCRDGPYLHRGLARRAPEGSQRTTTNRESDFHLGDRVERRAMTTTTRSTSWDTTGSRRGTEWHREDVRDSTGTLPSGERIEISSEIDAPRGIWPLEDMGLGKSCFHRPEPVLKLRHLYRRENHKGETKTSSSSRYDMDEGGLKRRTAWNRSGSMPRKSFNISKGSPYKYGFRRI